MAQILEGKIVLITGGAQGIGKAIGNFVLKNGGKVAALDIDQKAGERFASECVENKCGSSFLFLQCDVTNKSQLKDHFEKAKSHFGRLDIICNNAGVGDESNSFDRVIDINLTAVVQGTLQGIEYLSKEKGGPGGLIVNVGSMAGVVPVPASPVYSATKFGVVGFTRAFKGALTSQGIRINGICPVFVRTAMLEKALHQKGALVQSMIDRVGIVKIEEVVEAFRLLVEDTSLDGDIVAVSNRFGVGVIEFPAFTVRPPNKET